MTHSTLIRRMSFSLALGITAILFTAVPFSYVAAITNAEYVEHIIALDVIDEGRRERALDLFYFATPSPVLNRFVLTR